MSAREPKPCGTLAAYYRHLRHNETTCEPCRRANREYMAAYYAGGGTERSAATCGTNNGYAMHHRRGETACRACKDARNAYLREYRARKRSERAS